jgi:hypothetical protein
MTEEQKEAIAEIATAVANAERRLNSSSMAAYCLFHVYSCTLHVVMDLSEEESKKLREHLVEVVKYHSDLKRLKRGETI